MNARRTSFGFRTAAATAALGTALLFAAQSFAADTTTQNPPADQTQAAPATNDQSAAATQAKGTHSDRIEARIKELHAKLHITQAQEPQWDAYVQAMRDNASTMDQSSQQMNDLAKARSVKARMSAVDDLKAYEQYADARADLSEKHAEGLKKLVPAFEALYATMSDHQKKVTDKMFEQARRMHEAKEQRTKT